MTALTPERLAELRRLADEATPGDWSTLGARADGSAYVDRPDHSYPWVGHITNAADAAFIAAARSAVPELLDALARVEALADGWYGSFFDPQAKAILSAIRGETCTFDPPGDCISPDGIGCRACTPDHYDTWGDGEASE